MLKMANIQGLKEMNKNFLKIIIVLTLVLIGVIYYVNSEKEQTVKIGFIGALTGKYSVLGNAMMNGIYLKLEEENYHVGNKKIELILKDDKQDEFLNKKYINEFIENKIKIIIGNVTSTMSKVSMSIVNEYDDMFMISAASASNTFTGKDDRFFRVHVANNPKRFDEFTRYLIDKDFKKIYGIYDPFNSTYTKDFLENFEKSFIQNGGDRFQAYNKTDANLDLLVEDIQKNNPSLILICANSVDSARVIQYLRLKNITTQIVSSEWAMTNEFISNGGKAVEGVLFNIDYDSNATTEAYTSFRRRYMEKYKTEPSIFAAKAYELATIVLDALKNADETKIKEQVLSKRVYQGLQDEIVFDEYGDVKRNFYNFTIENGQFKRLDN